MKSCMKSFLLVIMLALNVFAGRVALIDELNAVNADLQVTKSNLVVAAEIVADDTNRWNQASADANNALSGLDSRPTYQVVTSIVDNAITNLPDATDDHSVLSNLEWTASGHYGTQARLAGFFEGGMAGYSYLGSGLYFGGSDELCVSNETIIGAEQGATAYGWGDHASAGYLTSYTETDPVYTQDKPGIPTYGAVTSIVDDAIAAMPEVKTYRLWDTSNHWYEVAGATVTEYWVDTSTGWVLNIAELEFSAPEAIPYPMSNFENLSLGIPAPYDWVTADSYYSEGIGHHFTIIDGSGVYQWYDAYLNGNETEITLPGVDGPPTLVFVYSTTYTTNVAQHVFITPAQALEYASHVGDSAVHVGATDRTNWDGKLDRLNGLATNSVLVNASVTDTFTLFSYQWSWNADRGTYDVALPGGVVGQLFQEQHAYCRNQTGSTIANGKLVCSAGAIGDNAAIRLFEPTDLTCAWGLIGMVTVDAGIAHGSNGQVTTLGEVNNLNTSMFAVSNRLWATTAGDVTNVEPAVAVGFLKYYVGIVLRSHPTEGRIYFNPQYCPNVVDVGAAPTNNAAFTGTLTLNGAGIWTPISQTTNALGKIVTITETNTLGGAVRTNFFSSSNCGVPNTGQTTSYLTGDDGDWEAGVALPQPRFTVSGDDLTVRDEASGLIWTKNCNIISNTAWSAAGVANWTNAVSFATNLNNLAYGGYTNWRLANRAEYASLFNRFQWLNPATSDATGTNRWTAARGPFTNLRMDAASPAGRYHTSTTYPVAPAFSWYSDTSGFYGTVSKTTAQFSLYCAGP